MRKRGNVDMAKETHTISVKGLLDAENRIITEYDKKGVCLGDVHIDSELAKFNGAEISFTIKLDKVLNEPNNEAEY